MIYEGARVFFGEDDGGGPYWVTVDSSGEFLGQVACGMAFDFGRAQGNLELRQVLLDAEMMRDCDERAAEEIRRLREELAQQRAIDTRLINEMKLARSGSPYAYSELNRRR